MAHLDPRPVRHWHWCGLLHLPWRWQPSPAAGVSRSAAHAEDQREETSRDGRSDRRLHNLDHDQRATDAQQNRGQPVAQVSRDLRANPGGQYRGDDEQDRRSGRPAARTAKHLVVSAPRSGHDVRGPRDLGDAGYQTDIRDGCKFGSQPPPCRPAEQQDAYGQQQHGR